MRVLSLYDGMACGMLAMLDAGVEVESYDAYEIDKYAVKNATHNFPMIREHGDVFDADFTQYEGVDWLIGGSPCTYWSIAQTKNRETEASGLGWELFSQYVRALHEAKPKFFIYENNKSMSKAIRDSIREAFGFEEICINSALVSAQNRQRYYWVGKRNADGTYSKVDVKQPKDRGILLKDVLDGVAFMDHSRCDTAAVGRTTTRECFVKNQNTMASEPVRADYDETIPHFQRFEVNDDPGKTNCLTTVSKDNMISEPVPMAVDLQVEGRKKNEDGEYVRQWEAKDNCKASALTSVQSRRMVATPVSVACRGRDGGAKYEARDDGLAGAVRAEYRQRRAEPVPTPELLCVVTEQPMRVTEATTMGYTEIAPGDCVDMTQPNSKTRRGRSMADKSNCLTTSHQYYQYCGQMAWATPTEWDENGIPTKATSGADNKAYTVYPVRDGQITIKEKTYPIKLVDGYYIIRKLTVSECKRLQTVPEWYEFCVSATQAYKMLGNGWTIQVISHLIKACLDGCTADPLAQLRELIGGM